MSLQNEEKVSSKVRIKGISLMLAVIVAVSNMEGNFGGAAQTVQAAVVSEPSSSPEGMTPQEKWEKETMPEETWKPGEMPEEIWKESPLGSAGVLEGKSVLVSIFVKDKETKWTKKEKKETGKKVRAAAKYLSSQAKRYGKKANLIVSTEKNKKLCYTFETDMKVTDRSHLKLNKKIQKFIDESIYVEEIRKKYKTDSVGFLLHINKSGVSYTLPHCVEEKDKDFYECSSMFSSDGYQETGAATFAHEILHLFGAPDLYERSLPDGITSSFVRYIGKKFPNEIMFTSYTKDGRQLKYKIKNTISRVTAYFLGWKEKIPEQKKYPLADNDPRGSFHDGTSLPNT